MNNIIKNFKSFVAFNSSRYRLEKEIIAFSSIIPSGSLILDAGAGDAPYKDWFKQTRYESADFEKVDKNYVPSTYVCDLASIPVESGRFDFIIFSQVLEHVSEPKLVLKELYRVLKPGGKMIYTGPLCYEEHEQPYDFFRYTQFGLRYLFKESGFGVERLDWLEGYFGTVAYHLQCMGKYLPIKPSDLGGIMGYILMIIMGILKPCFIVLSVFFHRLEKHIKFKKFGYPKNYIAVLLKK